MDKQTEYFYNIDFFRFIFACFIVTNHLVYVAGKDFLPSIPDFNIIINHFIKSAYVLDLFFIISGFLLIIKFKKTNSIINFIKSKIIRLWPSMIFILILFIILHFFKIVPLYLFDDIYTLLFLNGLGIANHTNEYNGLGNLHAAWFVSVLVYVELIFVYILKNFDKKFFNIFLIIVIISGLYSFNYNVQWIFNYNIIRGLYGVGIGCILGQFYLKYKNEINQILLQKTNIFNFLLFSCIEFLLFICLCIGLINTKFGDFVVTDYILIFIALMSLFILKKGFFSKILNNNFSITLGKFAYPIFISHCLLLELFKKFYFANDIWNKFLFLNLSANFITFIYLLIPTIICILFGIFTYYFIENPIIQLLKRRN